MIVWIHGAYSSCNAFNRFREHDWGQEVLIDYDCGGDLMNTVVSIRDRIESSTNEPVDLIGHSLGGVIAVAMQADGLNVRSIVTLAAPFGGIGGFWPKGTIGHEIKRLTQWTQSKPPVPHQFYVSMEGHNPWFLIPNDGVVPLMSQISIPEANYIQVPYNHFEIMTSDEVIGSVKDFHYHLNGSSQASRASGEVFT